MLIDELDLLEAEPSERIRVGDDSWLTVHTRADYTNAVSQLKASAENLNNTAASEPGWKPTYDNALRLYDLYHDVGFFSSINPFGSNSLNNSAWNAIADSQRRVDEFAAQMRSKGKAVLDPKHTPIDDSLLPHLPDLNFTKFLPWVIGGVVVLGLGSFAVPAVLPLLRLRGGAR